MSRDGGRLDLWLFALDVSPQRLGRLQETLSGDQIIRMRQLSTERERARYVAMHGRVRQVLGQRLGRSPQDVRLNTTPSGKPCLPDAPQLGYSISHCHGWGLLGLAVETEIGVDLERVTSRRVRLAELILSEEERLAWATCPENTRAEWITRAWVRKEALLKATGTGLGTRLTDINVMSAAGMQERMVDLTGPPTYVGAAHLLRSARAAELHIHTPQLSMAA